VREAKPHLQRRDRDGFTPFFPGARNYWQGSGVGGRGQ